MRVFNEQYQQYLEIVEDALQKILPIPGSEWPDEGAPKAIVDAVNYTLLSGGKRLRPVLLLAAFNTVSPTLEEALPFALAVEMIHNYSLIHDDLPAMDDDDLRRGKPTNHMVFGEAISILAGDGLLNLAYETMLRSCHPNTLDAMRVIAKRSGVSGMIAGQTADILLSGQTKTKNGVTYIHQHKTADLITASVVAGFVLAGVGDHVLLSADEYGKYLGFAFQISDDLLDLTGDPLLTGKAGQRDELLDKVTWPAVVGQKRAKIDAEDAVNRAIKAAEHFGNNKAFFQSLAMSLLNRVK